ncbi:MAG: GAF domain-containing protein [Acidobacteria bacterium]|nr:GAF domain-containing protein [Acidobacteriota bacterium]
MREPTRDGAGTAGGRIPPSSAETIGQLRELLASASGLLAKIEQNLSAASGSGVPFSTDQVLDLQQRLEMAEGDIQELSSRLVDSEHHAGRLMNLYVATFQLHATLDPEEVQDTIAEIAINLLGAEHFVLLLRKGQGSGECEVALAQGAETRSDGLYGQGRYVGGDAMVDATLDDGVLRIGPEKGSKALAAVPLRVEDRIVGALVLLKLLDHKPVLRAEDRDLLDLLSAHAASALFAARLFATKDRKLRTLESLVRLAQGE